MADELPSAEEKKKLSAVELATTHQRAAQHTAHISLEAEKG